MRTSLIEEIRAAIDYAVELPFPPAEEGLKGVFVD